MNLTLVEDDIGFIHELWGHRRKITTYQQQECGPSGEFHIDGIDYVPSRGDLVRIEYDEDPERYCAELTRVK